MKVGLVREAAARVFDHYIGSVVGGSHTTLHWRIIDQLPQKPTCTAKLYHNEDQHQANKEKLYEWQKEGIHEQSLTKPSIASAVQVDNLLLRARDDGK
jgi:hypothetical protein